MMTLEKKQAILDAYNDKSRKAKDIAEEFKISPSRMTKIIEEMGGQRRNANAPRKRGKTKKCPHCNTNIEVKGAKFCYNCGYDIRDEKDLLIERNIQLLKDILMLPVSVRDKHRKVILDTIEYLKKGQ